MNLIRIYRFYLPWILLLCGLPLPAAAQETATKLPITFETVYGPGATLSPFRHGAPRYEWLPDGEHLVQFAPDGVSRYHVATGDTSPLIDREKLANGLESLAGIDAATAQALAGKSLRRFTPSYDGVLIKHEDKLFFAKLDGSFACPLIDAAGAAELVTFSPNGQDVAFVRDNDLYAVDVATQTERRLTSDGGDLIRNGKADWVYWEEVFDRDAQAFWFNGDGTQIVFLRFDDTPVDTFAINNDLLTAQQIRDTRYPQAGTPNPIVEVGIASVAEGSVRWVDLSEYPAEDRLVVRAGWLPDGKTAYLYLQNRTQTWLDLVVIEPGSATPRRLLRETTQAWVSNLAPPVFLNDGSFLWESERTGWRHLYHYSADGQCLGAVTSGDWEVSRVQHVDEEARFVYFSGTKDSHLQEQLYRVSLDGGEPRRLTAADGTHRIRFSPHGRYYLDAHSAQDRATATELYEADGQLIRQLHSTNTAEFDAFEWGTQQMVQIETRDGDTLDGSLLRPADFDGARKYPVWLRIYGGPHYPTVRNRWSKSHQLFDEVLATAGIAVLRVDPRSASTRGAQSAWKAYRRLGVAELRDLEDAVTWLKAKPWVDGERIGLSGDSYGGFLTAFALTHSKSFAAGIAGAPVTDWRNYDTIYTERYMDTPQANPEGYDETSVVKAAADLHGQLLLLHGMQDDNVHLQNTTQLVDALQRAGRPFELMLYPRADHGLHGAHLARLKYDFIVRTMHPDSTNTDPTNR